MFPLKELNILVLVNDHYVPNIQLISRVNVPIFTSYIVSFVPVTFFST